MVKKIFHAQRLTPTDIIIKQPARNIPPEQTRAIRKLRNKDSGLTILLADKKCVTVHVVLDLVEYDEKIQQMLTHSKMGSCVCSEKKITSY